MFEVNQLQFVALYRILLTWWAHRRDIKQHETVVLILLTKDEHEALTLPRRCLIELSAGQSHSSQSISKCLLALYFVQHGRGWSSQWETCNFIYPPSLSISTPKLAPALSIPQQPAQFLLFPLLSTHIDPTKSSLTTSPPSSPPPHPAPSSPTPPPTPSDPSSQPTPHPS